MSLVEREGAEEVRRDELSRLIFQGGVRTVFHPIVRLADRTVIGHEALTRPEGDVSFHSVEDLFAFAETTELLHGVRASLPPHGDPHGGRRARSWGCSS